MIITTFNVPVSQCVYLIWPPAAAKARRFLCLLSYLVGRHVEILFRPFRIAFPNSVWALQHAQLKYTHHREVITSTHTTHRRGLKGRSGLLFLTKLSRSLSPTHTQTHRGWLSNYESSRVCLRDMGDDQTTGKIAVLVSFHARNNNKKTQQKLRKKMKQRKTSLPLRSSWESI